MITPDLLVRAIQSIDRRAKFCFADADINTIEWLEGYTPIPLADIQAQLDQLVSDEALKTLRTERDRRLAETDWVITMHKEKGTNIPAAWKTYRQALRDLPANTEDPANPVWPTKPE